MSVESPRPAVNPNDIHLALLPPVVNIGTVTTSINGVSSTINEWDLILDEWRKITGDAKLEDWQVESAKAILAGSHAIIIAPNGRSTVWILMLLALKFKKSKKFILLIGVTKAMQRDQVSTLAKYGFDVRVINEHNSTPALHKQFSAGEGDLWTISPEMLVRIPKIRNSLRSPKWRSQCAALVYDEAHTIRDWGRTSRPDILKLDQIRDAMGFGIVKVALAAILPAQQLMIALDVLGMAGCPIYGVDVGLDRPELFLDVRPFTYGIKCFADLAIIIPEFILPVTSTYTNSSYFTDAALEADSDLIPLSIVFCRTEMECMDGVYTFRRLLPPHLRSGVQAFHGVNTSNHRDTIVAGMKGVKASDGVSAVKRTYWVVFVTDAFGLGIEVPGIVYNIQWGDPDSFSSLALHQGKAGKGTGEKAKCIYFTSKLSFGPLSAPPPSPPLSTPSRSSTSKRSSPSSLTPSAVSFTERALEHRNNMFNKDPLLYRTINPVNNQCQRLIREELRPNVKKYIENVLGGKWNRLATLPSTLSYDECCSSCCQGVIDGQY